MSAQLQGLAITEYCKYYDKYCQSSSARIYFLVHGNERQQNRVERQEEKREGIEIIYTNVINADWFDMKKGALEIFIEGLSDFIRACEIGRIRLKRLMVRHAKAIQPHESAQGIQHV